jgi:hypothetical protein
VFHYRRHRDRFFRRRGGADADRAEERAACQADYDKYCKGTMPGGGRIIACLTKNPISEGCKKALAARKN